MHYKQKRAFYGNYIAINRYICRSKENIETNPKNIYSSFCHMLNIYNFFIYYTVLISTFIILIAIIAEYAGVRLLR